MNLTLPMFTTPSYGDRTLNEVQQCVNLYPEKTPQGCKLVGAPGLERLAVTANNAACRGVYKEPVNARIYTVHGNTIYRVISAGSSSSAGTIGTSSGRVSMAGNATQILTVDGTSGYITTLATDTTAAIADANLPTSPFGAVYLDGYFIVAGGSSRNQFYLTALLDGTDWTPVTFASGEASPDPIVTLHVMGRQLYVVGSRSIEVWYNTGSPSFPFERVTGAHFEIGTSNGATVASQNGALYFLGGGDGSVGAVYAISGGSIRKISPPSIESIIQAANLNTGTFFGYCWQKDGHDFYVLNNSALTRSLVYDASMDAWHEADSLDSGSTYMQHRAKAIISAFPSSEYPYYAFDVDNGNIYRVSDAYNLDDGNPIRRMRAFGPIEDGARRVFHHTIRFVLEVDHDSSASYTLEASLDWTDDGGLNWSTPRTLSRSITSGTTGQRVMLQTNRLGSSRQRYYRITLTGPAARIVLQSAELDADVGGN